MLKSEKPLGFKGDTNFTYLINYDVTTFVHSFPI